MTNTDPPSNPDRITHYALDGLVTLLALSRDIGIHSDLDTLLRRVENAALRALDCERLTVFVNEPMSQGSAADSFQPVPR